MRYIIILFISILLPSSLLAGGGWPQPKGKGFFKLNQSFLRAQSFYSLDGSLVDITTTTVYISSIYGEYGFTDRFTGILYAPLFVRSTINDRKSTINDVVEPGDAFDGIGDFQLGLKYGILTEGPVALSASLILGLPFGDNVGGDTELLQTGDGEFNQLLKLEASHSFYPKPIYATLSVGYNNRGDATFAYSAGEEDVSFSDEFHWGGEIGWTPSDKWLIALKWAQVASMNNGGNTGNTGASSIFGNNASYFAISPEVNYQFAGQWGVSASLGTAVSGENILAGPNIGFGIYWNLD
ncbi:MAG: hypothetical protein AAGH79_19455 [Bacteroidota bacterium]